MTCTLRFRVSYAQSEPPAWFVGVNGGMLTLLTLTGLNEELVQLLLLRDELHVEQDAMLVDIEDLTR